MTLKEKLIATAVTVLGVLYVPFYVIGFVMHFVARFILAISYLIMLDRFMAFDILKGLFTKYGKQ